MEKIYSEKDICGEFTVQKETIDFLLSYSKSLNYMTIGEFTFESHIN